jgi:hypothetical protein
MKVCIPYSNNESEQKNFDYILSNFSVDELFVLAEENETLPNTNIMGKGTKILSYKELPQDIPHVLLAPEDGRYVQGNISIYKFNHPEDAIYIVGSNNYFVDLEDFEKFPEHLVYIPTDTHDEMFNWSALGVILYDKRLKQWQTR